MRNFFRRLFWRVWLADYRRYRRWYGGVWERWDTSHPVCSFIWYQLEETTKERGSRPCVLCCGTPRVEDYR